MYAYPDYPFPEIVKPYENNPEKLRKLFPQAYILDLYEYTCL